MKWFCDGTSAFRGSLVLLQVLACSNFHCSPFLPPLSVCAGRGDLPVWPWAVCSLQAALGTSCLTPSQCPWHCAAFIPFSAAQSPIPKAYSTDTAISTKIDAKNWTVLLRGYRQGRKIQSDISSDSLNIAHSIYSEI